MIRVTTWLLTALALTGCTITQDLLSPPRELRASCDIADATPIAQLGLPQN